jgi:hypothetical protein
MVESRLPPHQNSPAAPLQLRPIVPHPCYTDDGGKSNTKHTNMLNARAETSKQHPLRPPLSHPRPHLPPPQLIRVALSPPRLGLLAAASKAVHMKRGCLVKHAPGRWLAKHPRTTASSSCTGRPAGRLHKHQSTKAAAARLQSNGSLAFGRLAPAIRCRGRPGVAAAAAGALPLIEVCCQRVESWLQL